MLTQRDKYYDTILKLRGEGKTQKQIGERLGISASSVGRIEKLPAPSDTPQPRKKKNRSTKTTKIVGTSDQSTATLFSCPSQQTLEIRTTRRALVSYLLAYGKQCTREDGEWVYRDDPTQLLHEVPGLRAFFSKFDIVLGESAL